MLKNDGRNASSRITGNTVSDVINNDIGIGTAASIPTGYIPVKVDKTFFVGLFDKLSHDAAAVVG